MPRIFRSLTLFHSICIAAFAIRLALIPNPGFEADISFWKSWGLATVDFGIVNGMKVTNNNYPTPFAYILGAMMLVYKLFADPHNFTQFWQNTNLLFLTISKLVPIIADIGIALLIVYIGKHAKKLGFPDLNPKGHDSPTPGVGYIFGLSFYELLSLLYLLSPLSIIDGAVWGQVDSLGLVIFLGALVLSFKKQSVLAGLVFMLAMMTKLQNMIYAPVFFLFLWQTNGFSGLIRGLIGATIGFAGLNIEFIATKNADRILASLTENYDYFPWMSLMSFNLWWIVTGAKGMITSDKLLAFGLLNAKTIGLMLFSSIYLFAVLRQLAEKKHPIQTMIESLILVNAAFFLFQTQSHDRYAFPLSAFLLLWVPFFLTETDLSVKKQRMRFLRFFEFYILFTAVYFYNLHTALVVNYPQNGLPMLSSLIQPVYTITAAYILIGLFGVFMYTLLRSSRTTRFVSYIVLVVFVVLVAFLNYPLLTKRPVSLTTFTPYISEQAYGRRQTNKGVQSSFGTSHTWTRLSVQYLFYKHGIGTHANSKHVFDIDKKFNTFTTDFGIDTEAGTKASAVFEIYGDGKLLFRSDKMGRFDLPKHISINITRVKYLTLQTNDAGDGNYDDHTDWLNPILYP